MCECVLPIPNHTYNWEELTALCVSVFFQYQITLIFEENSRLYVWVCFPIPNHTYIWGELTALCVSVFFQYQIITLIFEENSRLYVWVCFPLPNHTYIWGELTALCVSVFFQYQITLIFEENSRLYVWVCFSNTKSHIIFEENSRLYVWVCSSNTKSHLYLRRTHGFMCCILTWLDRLPTFSSMLGVGFTFSRGFLNGDKYCCVPHISPSPHLLFYNKQF